MLVNETILSVLSIFGVQDASNVDYNLDGNIYAAYNRVESGESKYRFANSSEIALNRVSKGSSGIFHELKISAGPIEGDIIGEQDFVLKEFNWSFGTDYGKIAFGRKVNNNLSLINSLMPETDDHYYSNTTFSSRFGDYYNNQITYSNYIRSVGFTIGSVEGRGEFVNLNTDIEDFSFTYSYWRDDDISQIASASHEFFGVVLSATYFSKEGFEDLYGLSAYKNFNSFYVGAGVFSDSDGSGSLALSSYYYVNSGLSFYVGANLNESRDDSFSAGVNFKF